MVQVGPFAFQDNLLEMLQKKGFRHHNNWAKLYRFADKPLPEVKTELEFVPVDTNHADIYGQIIFLSFNWQDSRLADLLASSVGQPGYHHYLVTLDNKAIAAGALHVKNEYASMALAGTLPAFRGMGAQSLLLRGRIEKARELGCEYMISETAEEKQMRIANRPLVMAADMQRLREAVNLSMSGTLKSLDQRYLMRQAYAYLVVSGGFIATSMILLSMTPQISSASYAASAISTCIAGLAAWKYSKAARRLADVVRSDQRLA